MLESLSHDFRSKRRERVLRLDVHPGARPAVAGLEELHASLKEAVKATFEARAKAYDDEVLLPCLEKGLCLDLAYVITRVDGALGSLLQVPVVSLHALPSLCLIGACLHLQRVRCMQHSRPGCHRHDVLPGQPQHVREAPSLPWPLWPKTAQSVQHPDCQGTASTHTGRPQP